MHRGHLRRVVAQQPGGPQLVGEVVPAGHQGVGEAAVEDHPSSLPAERMVGRVSTNREQPWSDDTPEHGRVVVVTDNPIGRAVATIAEIAGRRVTLLADERVEETPLEWLAANPLGPDDAFVMCDHDTPDMEALLRAALAGEAGYVAMMGSRRRAEKVFDALEAELPGRGPRPAARAGRPEHRRQGARRDRALRRRRGRRGLLRSPRWPHEGPLTRRLWLLVPR